MLILAFLSLYRVKYFSFVGIMLYLLSNVKKKLYENHRFKLFDISNFFLEFAVFIKIVVANHRITWNKNIISEQIILSGRWFVKFYYKFQSDFLCYNINKNKI